MSLSLNNVATVNSYTPNNTIALAGTVRVNIYVYNAAVLWRFSHDARGTDSQFQPEEFLAPGFYSFDRIAESAQVKSAVPGVPAQVTITLLTRADIGA